MYAEVWLNTPHYHAWTYLVPQGILVQAGDLVRVPFGKRQSLGLVAKVHEEKNKTNQKLRPLQEVLGPDYRLNPEILQLMTWAQSHYLAPPGEVLKNFLPSVILQGKKNQGERAKVRAPQFELEQKKLKLKQKISDCGMFRYFACGMVNRNVAINIQQNSNCLLFICFN